MQEQVRPQQPPGQKSNIRSSPIGSSSGGVPEGSHPALGIFAILLAAFFWLSGARFTVEGVVLFLNWLLSSWWMPWTIPSPVGMNLLIFAILVGLLFSIAEIKEFPFRKGRKFNNNRNAQMAVVWLIITIVDGVTTFVGLTNPPAGAWPIHQWTADTAWFAIIVSSVLTVLPEMMFVAGMHLTGIMMKIDNWRDS